MINTDLIEKVIATSLRATAPYISDPATTELSINPGGVLWVEANGVIERKAEIVSETDIKIAINAIAALAGQEALSGTLSSIVNASLNGMRIAGALYPVSPDGSFLTVRKHMDPALRPTLRQLVEWGSVTEDQHEILHKAFIDDRLNVLIVGSTGSGKTTYANALLKMIPHHQRIITIEDTEELSSGVPNLVRMMTDPKAGIHARDLVKHCLRLRPDRIIVGESRGDETFDVIRAFNSGHPGSLTTIHASSARLGLDMLEMLYQMSIPSNASISTDVVRKYIGGAVNMIIYVDRVYVPIADGALKSERKIREICFVKGVKDGDYILEDA